MTAETLYSLLGLAALSAAQLALLYSGLSRLKKKKRITVARSIYAWAAIPGFGFFFSTYYLNQLLHLPEREVLDKLDRIIELLEKRAH